MTAWLDDRTYVGEAVYGVQVIEHTPAPTRRLIITAAVAALAGALLSWAVPAVASPATDFRVQSKSVIETRCNAAGTACEGPAYILWVEAPDGTLHGRTFVDQLTWEKVAEGDVITVG